MSLETKTHKISIFPPKNHDGNFVPIKIEFFKAKLKLPCPRDSLVGLAIDSNELKLRTKRRQSWHDTPLGKIQVARLLHIQQRENRDNPDIRDIVKNKIIRRNAFVMFFIW